MSSIKQVIICFFIRFWAVTAILFVFLGNLYAEKIPNVILVTLSGVRWSESLDDPTHQYIPNLWHKIFKEGTLYTNVIDSNFEFHMPTLHAINTGITYSFVTRNGPTFQPSIFQYVRKKYKLPMTKVWIMGNWYPGDCFHQTQEYSEDTRPASFSMARFNVPDYVKNILSAEELTFFDAYEELVKRNFFTWPHWDAIGKIQFRVFNKIIKAYKPKFLYYVMNNVDAAHYGSFARYVFTLKDADAEIMQIWNLINEDEYYKDNTYLIITPDHERDAFYMDHDHNPSDNPSIVWMYIFGPKVKKNRIINRAANHTDIFTTIAYIMNVDTHPNEGKVLEDCFKDGLFQNK